MCCSGLVSLDSLLEAPQESARLSWNSLHFLVEESGTYCTRASLCIHPASDALLLSPSPSPRPDCRIFPVWAQSHVPSLVIKSWSTEKRIFWGATWLPKNLQNLNCGSMITSILTTISSMVMHVSEKTSSSTLAMLLPSSALDGLLLFCSSWTLVFHLKVVFVSIGGVIRKTDILNNSKHLMNLVCCFALQMQHCDYTANLSYDHNTTSYTTDPVSCQFLCYMSACTWHTRTEDVNQPYFITMVHSTAVCVDNFKLKCKSHRPTLLQTLGTCMSFRPTLLQTSDTYMSFRPSLWQTSRTCRSLPVAGIAFTGYRCLWLSYTFLIVERLQVKFI